MLIGGTATNVCCESSARDAMMLNFKVVMVHDVLATYTDEEHNATLRTFYSIFGDVQTHRRGDRLAQARAGEGGGVGFRGGAITANSRAGVSTKMRRRWAHRRPLVEQVDEMAVVGHDLGGDLRVRPVGAPEQPLRIGAQQRLVERLRVGIVRIPLGQAIRRRQLHMHVAVTDQPQQRLEGRVVGAAFRRHVEDVVEDDGHLRCDLAQWRRGQAARGNRTTSA